MDNKLIKKAIYKVTQVLLVLVIIFLGVLLGYSWGKQSLLDDYNFCHPWLEQYAGTTHKLTDRINESQIQVFKDRVVIIGSFSWASYASTNSMLPLIDGYSNGLYYPIDANSDLRIGDVISFHAPGYDEVIVHRIVDIGVDEEGIWYQTKGDNSKIKDPFKIRRGDMIAVLVGVLW
jgi:hypothetical protein